GTLVLKSTYAHDFIFNPAPLVVNEITLLGSRCGPLDKAVALLESKKIKPERLIAKSFPLADAVAATDKAKQKGVLKVLIDFL
ncbi:MAG: theronine dehydrogenase-like Zn-dependent dehydrogenase, partial [Gammaproteobacteria bacterium]|nr:theronine dehydrogenase-like Zn-dependent dehydrogenase [Gammaproteobacteria bacterium]